MPGEAALLPLPSQRGSSLGPQSVPVPVLEAVAFLPSSFCHPRQLPALPLRKVTSSRLDQAWVNILYVQRSPRPDLVPFGSSGIIRNNLLAVSKEKPQVKDSKV